MQDPNQPINLLSFPKAIVHIDGDAFFASVEQSANPALKGRPIVTGKERGIIACASYEAKRFGVKRGIALHDARKMCPDLVVLPSDYETYSLYSRRMFEIMRRYTPFVEENSIDEGFSDITGMRRVFRCSYEDIARRMKEDIQKELDITVSLGLSLSKSLAKLASKFRKPAGFTAIAGHHIHIFLQRHSLDDVWGFGPNTARLLETKGLKTAYDFALQSEKWAGKILGKTGREIWHELRGIAVYPIMTEEKSSYATISKCKTFTAPSKDADFIYAKLLRNIESAFIKMRRHKLRAKVLSAALRKKDYNTSGMEAVLNRSTSSTHEVIPLVRELFERLYESGAEYRATMIVLGKLESDRSEQYELFEDRLKIDKMRAVSGVIDKVNGEYGKHKIGLGTALYIDQAPRNNRDEQPERKQRLLPGETFRCRLGIPSINISV